MSPAALTLVADVIVNVPEYMPPSQPPVIVFDHGPGRGQVHPERGRLTVTNAFADHE